MSDPTPLLTTDLPLKNRRVGKVRDVYDGVMRDGRPCVVLVATDRLSAFDVVLPDGIPGKGRVLTSVSAWWFARLAEHFGERLPLHLWSTDPGELSGLSEADAAGLAGRVLIGRPTEVVPIECVVRGYLAGLGWAAYQRDGAICGVPLPVGMQESECLSEPIFTPTTKAAEGHDEPVTYEQASDLVGGERMRRMREMSMMAYRFAHRLAESRGILLADTKLEFGVPVDGPADALVLIDEVFTPDSSRFWPAEGYGPGRGQPSYDKQFVRDYLSGLVDQGLWDRTSPGPKLPAEIVEQTVARYAEAEARLLGSG